MIPDDLRYTDQHEWVQPVGSEGAVRVGVTDYAQDALGDIVYVTLPEPGTRVVAGEPCGELESTKSVSDVYAPVSGTVTASNDMLETAPQQINSDPYGDGWLFEVGDADPAAVGRLLDAAAYRQVVDSAG